MESSPTPDLIKITEIFLVPSSFLVAALGTADTNLHRAAVSLLGLIVSALWWICSHEAITERPRPAAGRHPRRTRILSWMSIVFVLGWLMSLVVHALIWNQPLGHA